MENLLIVNADDFGLSKGQNYGIIEACRRGVVTSTTALINGEAVEHAAQIIFTVCGFFAVLAVASITIYMIISGTPALFKVGIVDILFGTVWKPEAAVPAFGIL